MRLGEVGSEAAGSGGGGQSSSLKWIHQCNTLRLGAQNKSTFALLALTIPSHAPPSIPCIAGPHHSLTRSPFNTLQAAFRSSCGGWRGAIVGVGVWDPRPPFGCHALQVPTTTTTPSTLLPVAYTSCWDMRQSASPPQAAHEHGTVPIAMFSPQACPA